MKKIKNVKNLFYIYDMKQCVK